MRGTMPAHTFEFDSPPPLSTLEDTTPNPNATSAQTRSAVQAITQLATDGAGGRTALLSIPAFVLLYLVLGLYGHAPRMMALVYALMSLLCFIAYAWDKSAAHSGKWRTKERTLLLLGLLCGWPGAVLAQQLLRHKSAKTSFQIAFWATVVLNVAGFLVLIKL